jgi:hypothetical protein
VTLRRCSAPDERPHLGLPHPYLSCPPMFYSSGIIHYFVLMWCHLTMLPSVGPPTLPDHLYSHRSSLPSPPRQSKTLILTLGSAATGSINLSSDEEEAPPPRTARLALDLHHHRRLSSTDSDLPHSDSDIAPALRLEHRSRTRTRSRAS